MSVDVIEIPWYTIIDPRMLDSCPGAGEVSLLGAREGWVYASRDNMLYKAMATRDPKQAVWILIPTA